MPTAFQSTVRPVLALAKCIGFMNVCYAFDPTGSTVRYADKTRPKFLELTRTSALLACTYMAYKQKFYYLQTFDLLQFWACVIAARMSAERTIRLVNGVVGFDRDLSSLPASLSARQRSLSKTRWNAVVAVLVAYAVGFRIFLVGFWPPKDVSASVVMSYGFSAPILVEMTVVAMSWFFLVNIECRFRTLNDIVRERLPAGLVAVPGQWTHPEIATTLESVRLLHARLSDLVGTFNAAFGPLLLNFFVFGFVNLLFRCFYSVDKKTFVRPIEDIHTAMRLVSLFIMNGQTVVFMTSTIVIASRITDKMKMFMNQISISESNEVTAYGFFNINLNLIISILVLLVSGVSTILQMKNHPILVKIANESAYTAHNSFENRVVT